MIRPIMHSEPFLAMPSIPATPADIGIGKDLLDTLEAHQFECVGMAANMIGISKQIIAFENGFGYMVMYNPEIIKKSGRYEAQESCLSLLGGPRKAIRYKKIRIRYQTESFEQCEMNFSGWTAQIIQHEIDHCNGILI